MRFFFLNIFGSFFPLIAIVGVIFIMRKMRSNRSKKDGYEAFPDSFNKGPYQQNSLVDKRLITLARVVSKRTAENTVSPSATESNTSRSKFYITFGIEGGGRLEFLATENRFSSLNEGDIGRLYVHNGKFLDFEKKVD